MSSLPPEAIIVNKNVSLTKQSSKLLVVYEMYGDYSAIPLFHYVALEGLELTM